MSCCGKKRTALDGAAMKPPALAPRTAVSSARHTPTSARSALSCAVSVRASVRPLMVAV